MSSSVEKKPFGRCRDGSPAHIFTLKNTEGITVSVTDYGATLVSFICPDKSNQFADIVLGFDTLQGYLDADTYMGATVGRFANRIAEGQFSLHGKTYTLEKNNARNHLHGGNNAFDKRVWKSEYHPDGDCVRFLLSSPDGDNGYPGELSLTCTYRLSDENTLSILCEATTTKATPISLTHHSYFNLSGSGSAMDHVLKLNCDRYTPLNANQIPTGEIATVSSSPFDFREAKTLAQDIGTEHPQLRIAGGYDHNFVIQNRQSDSPVHVGCVGDKNTGRQLDVYTNAPGIQLYTANFLDGSTRGKGIAHEKRSALCLEPQHFPDAPNRPEFPDCILQPGETYRQMIAFKASNAFL